MHASNPRSTKSNYNTITAAAKTASPPLTPLNAAPAVYTAGGAALVVDTGAGAQVLLLLGAADEPCGTS